MAADARSVWVKVEYRRPFSGGSIGGGVTARRGPQKTRRGPQKTRRGPKVQRGPNLQTRFEPRSTLDHSKFVHMQRIYGFYFILEF